MNRCSLARIVPLVLVAMAWLPVTAQAQDKVGISVSSGLLAARNAAPLGDFQRPLFMVSVQRVFADHFVLEGELTHWTYLRHLEFGPHAVTGPNHVGTVTGSETNSSHKFWNYGVNALVRSTGRVRVFGGAGLGLSHDDNDYWQQSYGCSTSLDPAICARYQTHYNRGGFMVRALGGGEVPLMSRIGLVGSARFEKTSWEDRRDWVSATAGIRFAFD